MIFFFSGTGNSLYAARQIAEVAGESMRSIAQAINDETPVYADERIGIVCPVYSHDLPPLVKRFIERSTFSTPYFFVALTHGNRAGGAQEIARRFLAERGIELAYSHTLLMVDNWLPGYDIAVERASDKHIDENLAAIAADVAARRRYLQPATADDLAIYEQGLQKYGDLFANLDFLRSFLAITERCTGCTTCTRICPAGCIELGIKADGLFGAVRDAAAGNVCTACLACVHACPAHAIEISMGELNPEAHFTNEHTSIAELIEANDQGVW